MTTLLTLMMRRGALALLLVLMAFLMAPASIASASVCGDDVTEAPEICDGLDDAACPGDCLPPGNPNECKCPVCGDGDANRDVEECDGGDDTDCPGQCQPTCLCPACGNDMTEGAEICDGTDDVACPGLCLPQGNFLECQCPTCGDGLKNQPSEECDGTDAPTCADKCLADCTCAVCGDNVAESPAETCDGTDDSACPGLCQAPGQTHECQCPFCGDSVVNQASEQCDRFDDAACPGHCSLACTCAVCGDNLAEPKIETCDGTDDMACPGQCFPPGDAHECVCPITLNKCAAKKQKCALQLTTSLVKCHISAEVHGALVEPTCLQKFNTRFEGVTPPKGCFEKLEFPGHCFTEDDTATIQADVQAFVDALVQQVDPSYPMPILDRCGGLKKKCAAYFAAGLFGCRIRAEGRNLPVDPVCIQKYTDRFDGGPVPSEGCFEKAEAKTTCQTVDDTALVEGMVNDFVEDVVCALDPHGPDCP